ncbi:LPS translocon maturation chaperone LptM [Pseudaquabacterium pictum]|uniref:LPS translocon maturation chaperone LptM n=1 Tax=Pseudaquabacterium pictum TaxID=2315236 RepID=UPI003570FFDB
MSTTSSSSQRSTVASTWASTAWARRWNSLSDSAAAAGVVGVMVHRIRAMELRSSLASRAALLLAMLLGTAALSGCGQKGPLTLPQPPAGAASAPTK